MKHTVSLALMLVFGSSLGVADGLPPPVARDIVTDSFGRVIQAAGKESVPCPGQNKRTAVILTIGQSNAANYASRAYRSTHGSAVVNFFDGKCYLASSPLLGADGPWGEYWTELGNRLVESGAFERVVLVSSAIGGSSVAQWQIGGMVSTGQDLYFSNLEPRSNLNAMLMNVLSQLRPHYRITHVLWHQGESDFGTSAADYTRSFMSLVESIRNRGVTAPIFVSVTSADRKATLPVVQAQRALWDPAKNIFPGVDTDASIEDSERNETGHFGPVAQEKVINAWFAILNPRGTPRRPGSAKN